MSLASFSKYLLILFVFTLSFPSFSEAALVYFDRFSVEDGLTQSSVTCAVEDNLGFTWLGSQNGLNKLDGYSIETHKEINKQGYLTGSWITACVKDRSGQLWFSTASKGINRYDPTTGLFEASHWSSRLQDKRVLSMLMSDTGELLVGSASGSLNIINLSDHSIKVATQPKNSIQGIRALYQSSNGTIWIGSASGLYYFDQQAAQIKPFILGNENEQFDNLAVWSIAEDHENRLWITGRGGLFRLNVENKQLRYFELGGKAKNWGTSVFVESGNRVWVGTYGSGVFIFDLKGTLKASLNNDPLEGNSLSNDYILSLYQSTNKHIWIGTDGGGVNRYIPSRLNYHHHKHNPDDNSTLSHSFVRAITQDTQGQLWVVTREGVNRRELNSVEFKRYYHDKEHLRSLAVNNVFALFSSKTHGVWLGTYGGGLLQYSSKTDDFTQFKHHKNDSESLISDRIYAIAAATDDSLWLGSNKGLSLFNTQTFTSQHFKYDPNDADSLSDNVVFSVLQDNKERVWVGTRLGLNLLNDDRRGFTHFRQESGQLTANMVTALHQDLQGYIWVGTMQGLNRLDPQTNEVVQFTQSDGLVDENIFAIEEDQLGYLWISTNYGLMKLNKSTQAITHVKPEVGLQGRSFILGASHQGKQGELYFGGVNGFNYFDPKELASTLSPPRVSLKELLLLNQPVRVQDKEFGSGFNLSQHINFLPHLYLDYQHNLFALEFTSSDSLMPEPIDYAYRLVGFDRVWLNASSQQRVATYTNLSSGTYQFEVKARFAHGEWGPIKTLDITVTPAPWLSWWALTSYILLSLSVIAYGVWLIYHRRIAEQEKIHSQAMIAAKDNLLATISHEFKTPLTMISGPIERLIVSNSDPLMVHSLAMMRRNADRLLGLVNDILQTRNINDDTKPVVTVDLCALSQLYIEGFKLLAAQKSISLTGQLNGLGVCNTLMQVDAADQIMSNLLYNAIKFTPEHGQVELSLDVMGDRCCLRVKDTGVGIDVDELDGIFKQYKRGRRTNELEGHGLGLAIVQDIVQQHQGVMSVTSTPNLGSEFTVSLPIQEYQYGSCEQPKIAPSAQPQMIIKDTSAFKILIVEDNADLRAYLETFLQPYYQCFSAINGEVGLEQARALQPDLIISDVMMPILSGFELLSRLREDLDTCHIPVLILTAYHTEDMRLKGFDLLADEFLAKPFNEAELLSRINNLLSIRQLLTRNRNAFEPSLESDNNHNSHRSSSALSHRDHEFVNQLNTALANLYRNTSMSLEELAHALCTTERTLQNKTRALFNLSPMDYVRDYRLNQAKLLLTESSHSIGVISELCGFNSQSYFARCFKAATGLSPKQYRHKETLNL